MKTWVQLAKHGDILSLCPILHEEFKTTGIKPRLIVAAEYASILERVSYVEPVIWPGNWQDLKQAIVFAKQRFPNVVVPQIFGKDFPIAKHTPSFQLDQWLRAGYLDKWDTLPMVIDRISKRASSNGSAKVILYADHSQGSPFPLKDTLYRLLADNFNTTHTVKRLSEVRCKNPLDLLALFDSADCLVTVETMMLHLSAASTVPTVALVADSPTRWKGAAWSKRFLAHIRYADFVMRQNEIVTAVKRALNKEKAPNLELIRMPHEFAYNPSIIRYDNNVLTSYRYHPSSSWRTELAITNGSQTWKVDVPKFADHSLEDMRLFEHQGKLFGSFTIARSTDGMFRCVCAYGELSFQGNKCVVLNLTIPKYGKNDFSSTEKNLCFFSHNDRLFFSYLHSPEHVVIEIDRGKVIKEYRSPSAHCDYGVVRGGTRIFPYRNNLLKFCHVLQRNERSDQWWTYHIAAVLLEPQPPFSILAISKQPILSGTEQYFHWSRYKPRVLIPYGAIADGNGWKVSVGVNDSACGMIKITEHGLHF